MNRLGYNYFVRLTFQLETGKTAHPHLGGGAGAQLGAAGGVACRRGRQRHPRWRLNDDYNVVTEKQA